MNEKFNKNAEVEKLTNVLGIAVRLIVIDPLKVTIKLKIVWNFNIISNYIYMH